MLTLPLITPRDSHELWFGSSRSHRTSSPSSHINQPVDGPRRNAPNATTSGRGAFPFTSTGESLSALQLEERTLRARKNNIASFGYSWIKPAGCAKTMLGMKEEEAEREEALAAAAQEMAAAAAAGHVGDEMEDAQEDGEEEEGMERDLDDDIPDAEVDVDADGEGLVEEGEEGLEEDDLGDEEGYMERDLDDDVPEAYPDDQDDSGLVEGDEYDVQYEDFDNQPDLDDDIPAAGGDGAEEAEEEIISDEEGMGRDLDDDIPQAAEDGLNQEEEWQHTDSEAEFDDDDDDIEGPSFTANSSNFRTSTSSTRGLPPPPSLPRGRGRETEAQRRFLQRWSGGGDAFADSSSMLVDEDDLRASTTSHSSRRSLFGRFSRRNGGPRDSFG